MTQITLHLPPDPSSGVPPLMLPSEPPRSSLLGRSITLLHGFTMQRMVTSCAGALETLRV